MEEVLREKAHGVIDEDLTIFDVLYSFGDRPSRSSDSA